MPIWTPKNGMIRAVRMASPTPAAIQRCRTTSDAHLVQNRLAVFSCRIRGQSTRGPMPPSRAGNSVVVTATLTSGMSIPP